MSPNCQSATRASPCRLRLLERAALGEVQLLQQRVVRLTLDFPETTVRGNPPARLGLELVERRGRSPYRPPRERAFADQREGVSEILQLFPEHLDQLHQLLGGELALARFNVGKRLAVVETQLGGQFVLTQAGVFPSEFHPLPDDPLKLFL
ncbi:MAG: hypothetical protein M5U12_00945 [Verrucomicrobia bacterium]|nr:hypothetical protein [Verrucomicrobiota bacterium]